MRKRKEKKLFLGITFDKNGNPAEWLSIMSQEYGKRANCFVEQFNNYPIEKNSNKTIPVSYLYSGMGKLLFKSNSLPLLVTE